MKALLDEYSFSLSSFQIKRPTYSDPPPSSCIRFPLTGFNGRQWRRKLLSHGGLKIKAALDAVMEQFGLKESDIKNPALSSTYSRLEIPKANPTILDAQARVCTGPNT